jgi:cell division protein FtsX
VLGLASTVAVALAVSVVGGTVAGLAWLGRLGEEWTTELRLVALVGEPRAGSGDGLVDAARALPGAGEVRYVSAREALDELRRYLGLDAESFERLPVNPVSARLEVAPRRGLRATELEALGEGLRRLPGVEEVQAALAGVRELERWERHLRHAGFGLGAALAGLAGLVVAGAARHARARRADETAVLRLAGVSETRLGAPLRLAGLGLGVVGAALGAALLFVVTDSGVPWVGGWIRQSLGGPLLPGLKGPVALGLLVGGAGLGLLGGCGAGRP